MFEINATFLIFAASFLVFMALLNQIMLKPVGRVIDQRSKNIKAQIEAGKQARAEAEEVLNQYHQHLHKTRMEAQAIINEAVEKASYHRHCELSRLKEEGQKKLEEARAAIVVERNGLMEALVAQESGLVSGIVAKLIGKPVPVHLEPEVIRRTLEEAC